MEPSSPQPLGEPQDPPSPTHPALNPQSEHEANEELARHQLKNTTIDSIKKAPVASTADEIGGESTDENDVTTSPLKETRDQVRAESPPGRPVRKRSFDNSDSPPGEELGAEMKPSESLDAHSKKRSCDVRSIDPTNSDSQGSRSLTDVVHERTETTQNEKESSQSDQDHDMASSGSPGDNAILSEPSSAIDEKSQDVASSASDDPSSKAEGILHPTNGSPGIRAPPEDHEMQEGVYNLRKKRSRDQLGVDGDREQKILATEIAKAQRRSDEISRGDAALRSKVAEELSEKNLDTSARSSSPEKGEKKPTQSSGFGVTSTIRPPESNTKDASPSNASMQAEKATSSSLKPASAQAFASSGFASLAASTTSPFSVLTGSSSQPAASPFASASKPSSSAIQTQTKTANSGFGSFGQASTAGASGISPFGTAGTGQSGSLGASVFGAGFGGGFGAGPKLTSFATATGNANLGKSNGTIQPIGSPSHDEAEKEGSESEADGGEGKKEDESSETDERFQQQHVETGEDGEESIFLARASLYAYKESSWKESGKGTFKLNVPVAPDEEPHFTSTVGRFIMRAHQTHRLLLNAPIIPQMKVGSPSGTEPTAKSFTFGVVEDGKSTPYLVKLGDVSESKALYRQVRKLQQQ